MQPEIVTHNYSPACDAPLHEYHHYWHTFDPFTVSFC